ncbi:hypothetical protein OWR29_24545 [Actinoplanes sp. Pm04-4]|uniref:Uncharacterized protein n=1 Tax=Paractinoplanes pyxinae TaxID=2997416 RepID=A0ABT4B3X7_9ACTN|nr:hypothetical protein [Actinoplanes pyxinae]MCY1141181.1 hypothetical protein [Actinoplanes pyxinae]
MRSLFGAQARGAVSVPATVRAQVRCHSRSGSGCRIATGPCRPQSCSIRPATPERQTGPTQSLTTSTTRRLAGSTSRPGGSGRPRQSVSPSPPSRCWAT